MNTQMKKNGLMKLSETQLSSVNGGNDILRAQMGYLSYALTPFLLMILEATKPSYKYSHLGANFMSLMLEWAEYYYGVDGKKQSDYKCRAIIATLKFNGFDTNRILQVFREHENLIKGGMADCA